MHSILVSHMIMLQLFDVNCLLLLSTAVRCTVVVESDEGIEFAFLFVLSRLIRSQLEGEWVIRRKDLVVV